MLKSLELCGFKSFADRTSFDFPAGITGVVGPNGSGKSNVVDAIKWILGDQSARSLRGKDMTDVIFNGSASRGPSQYAEATLLFDNTSRFLPLEQDEVAIGRRLWQSGDSEYLIDRNTARLKDVRSLFAGTGAGASAYCIIEQGRVDQILQSNAANRRAIFEEAAGVSTLRLRRTEALRRLERVEQNLVRLGDLVDEVESQVNSLRSQAQRATRFKAVSTELETLWIGLAADDFRRESVQRNTLQTQSDQLAAEIQELQQRHTQADQEVRSADEALHDADEKLRERESHRSEIRSRIASLETSRRHLQSRRAELTTDVQRLTRQQTHMQLRVGEAEAELNSLRDSLETEHNAVEHKRSAVSSGNEEISALRQMLSELQLASEACQQEQLEHLQQKSALDSQLDNLRTQLAQTESRMSAVKQKMADLEQETLQLVSDTAEYEDRLGSSKQLLEEAEQAADQLISNREKLQGEKSLGQQTLAELREQRSGLIARKAVLEDLEDRQEGFGIGVREILRRADESNTEPWNLILGSVADLLDVDMEHAALLEVALSGRAQLLAVSQLGPLMDYITSGRCRITDRVGFISMESCSTDSNSMVSLREELRRIAHPEITTGTPIESSEDLWWSRFDESGRADDASEHPFSSADPPPGLQAVWADPRSESPVERSIFTQFSPGAPQLFGRQGIVGRADALARSPGSMPDLAAHLLADTWVTESLADALHWHRETRGSCRFVTIQGELIEADGTLYAGTVRNESALLSRKSELRRLRNELHRLEHEVAQRELALRSISSSITETDEQLKGVRGSVERQTTVCRNAESALTEHLRRLQDCEKREQELLREQRNISEELKNLTGRLSETVRQQQAEQESLAALQQRMKKATSQYQERTEELESLKRSRTSSSLELTRSEERLMGLQESLDRVEEDLSQRKQQQSEALRRLTTAEERARDLQMSQLNTSAEIAEYLFQFEELTGGVSHLSQRRSRLRAGRNKASEALSAIQDDLKQRQNRFHELDLRIQKIDHQLQSSAARVREEYQIEVNEAVADGASAIAVWQQKKLNVTAIEESEDNDSESPPVIAEATDSPCQFNDAAAAIIEDHDEFQRIRTEIDHRIERLRRQLRRIGNVGTESLDNLNELESRFQRLHLQLSDLEAARDALGNMVRRINVESRRMFLESFETIRGYFRDLFRRLFGGGEADLILEDPEDVLECSIDVVARPPGKELRSISLLSGGEKTLTAVALLLAIFRSRTSPFCLLDEVDAALDDANIGRFVNVLRDFQQQTQFIMITHRKPTMAVTDVLYGVTMEESGISRRLSLRFEDVDEQGNFLAAARDTKAA